MTEPKENRIPVLFLVLEFPPVNTTGNYRSLKFVKYLRRFGIEPIVVTLPAEDASAYYSAPIDQSLMQDIPEGTFIYRIPCEPPTQYRFKKLGEFLSIYFSIEDGFYKKWLPNLEKQLPAIMEKHKPVAVYTSLPPFGSGRLAVHLAKKVYHLPLVLDMRDLWAFFGATPLNSWFHFKAMLGREARVFKKADAIIGVTPQMLEIIKRSHPHLPHDKLHLVYNGYDFNVRETQSFTLPPGKEKITIGYIGAFYFYPDQRDRSMKPWWKKPLRRMPEYSPIKQDWLYRSPYFFFQSINELFKRYPEYKNRVSIEFIGKVPNWLPEMIKNCGLENQVQLHGFLPKEEAMAIAGKFDLVLATSEKMIDGEHFSLASKVFDYIILKKPVLAFVTPGIQRTFFEQSGSGIICDPDQPEQVVELLKNLFEHGRQFSLNYDYLDTFHRKELTARLAGIIRRVTGLPEEATKSN